MFSNLGTAARNLAANPRVWDYPLMTTTLDAKKRAVLSPFSAGEIVQIEPQIEDALVLRRMRAVAGREFKPRVVRRKNGDLVLIGICF